MQQFDLKIFTDTDCDIYIDGSCVVKLSRGSVYKTTLNEGEYIVQAKTANQALVYREILLLSRHYVLEISFEGILRERKDLISKMKLYPFIEAGSNLYGFMDIKSKTIVIPAYYDLVYAFNQNGLAIVKKGGKYGIINKLAEEIIPIEYTKLRAPFLENNDLALDRTCVLSNDKGDGIVDACGTWKLLPDEGLRLKSIHTVKTFFFSSILLYLFVNQEGEKMVFDGKKFILKRAKEVRFCDDLIVFKNQKKDSLSYSYGVMTYKGQLHFLWPSYNISDYQKGYAWAEKGKKAGWIDKFGNFKFIPDKAFDKYGPFDGNLALVSKGDKVGFIDVNNNLVIPLIYDAASPFTEDRAIVSQNGLIGMIDSTGKELCPCVYELFRKPNCMSFPLAIVMREEKYGCINKDGEEQIPCIYKDVCLIKQDLIAVKNEENLWGFINDQNEQVIPFEFTNVYGNDCHLYNINNSCFWETIPSWQIDIYQYSVCKKSLFGCVVVQMKGTPVKYGILNKQGRIVPCEYDITPPTPFRKMFDSFEAKDRNDMQYHIFTDGTILPVSLAVI